MASGKKGKGGKAKKRQVSVAAIGSNWQALLNKSGGKPSAAPSVSASPSTNKKHADKKGTKNKNKNKRPPPRGGLQPRPNQTHANSSSNNNSRKRGPGAISADPAQARKKAKKRDPAPNVDPKPRRYVASRPLTDGEFMEDSHPEFRTCVDTR
jgi:hypothetical protein